MNVKSFMVKILAAASLAVLAGGWGFLKKAHTPPVEVPIALHQAGSIATTDLFIPPDNRYRCGFTLDFLFHDRTIRQRLLSFLGGLGESGTIIPVRLTILMVDGEKTVPFHEKEYQTKGIVMHDSHSFSRLIDRLSLGEGKYQVRLEGLTNLPELNEIPVQLNIYYIQAPK